MYQNDAMKVLTGEVRLSYANLTTPRAAQQGGEPKYSVTLLIPKSDAATKADIDAAIQAAANEAMAKVWNGARPPMLKVPIYDGDGVRPSGVPFGDECKGHWVMTASTVILNGDQVYCDELIRENARLTIQHEADRLTLEQMRKQCVSSEECTAKVAEA